jgi:radical SAM superfamily enzyme YgiQ (UPF0313 family)
VLDDTDLSSKTFKGVAPPLGLLYLAKAIQENGDEVSILDFSAEPYTEEKLKNALKKADVVGITVLSFTVGKVAKLIKVIKKIRPEIKIIIGGPHCSLYPEKSLKETQADVSIQGEGEFVIKYLKKALQGKISFSEIPGVWYNKSGRICQGKPFKLINNLDAVSFPARHLLKKYVYGREYYPKIKAGEFTTIVASRGCPFNCKFCSRNVIGMKTYRYRSAKNILNEIKDIQKQGYKVVAFEDDSCLANKKQAIELFEGIIKEKINLKFIATAIRVDAADKKLFALMKKAGVTHLQFGLESGNQDVLEYYNKKIDLEKIKYAVNLSSNMGFFTIGTFMLGAPFETKKHFKKTINFAKSLPLDSVSFLPLKYITGSELWCTAVDEGKISENEYLVYADSKRNLGNFTHEELISISNHAHREYYMQPKFFLRLLIKSLKNNDLGFIQSYLSLFFSNLIGSFRFLGFSKKTVSYDS